MAARNFGLLIVKRVWSGSPKRGGAPGVSAYDAETGALAWNASGPIRATKDKRSEKWPCGTYLQGGGPIRTSETRIPSSIESIGN
jgi:hypothetical protein